MFKTLLTQHSERVKNDFTDLGHGESSDAAVSSAAQEVLHVHVRRRAPGMAQNNKPWNSISAL